MDLGYRVSGGEVIFRTKRFGFMTYKYKVNLNSEVGRLRSVILHRPGLELEQMTPSTIRRALYSDLLSTETAAHEYRQLEGVLSQVCEPFYIDNLLAEVLDYSKEARAYILDSLRKDTQLQPYIDPLKDLPSQKLAERLIQGEEGSMFNPLYNFYFTRDIGVAFNGHAMPTHMATQVRSREILITDTIFKFHPFFAQNNAGVNPWDGFMPATRFEGGDFQVAAPDVFVIGQGARTNRNGVDAFIEIKSKECEKFHVITQELPFEPESFIHLDMVFTFLSKTHCMAYKPLIMDKNRYMTRLLTIEKGVVRETVCDTIFDALHRLGYDYQPVFCGNDSGLYPDREQWHSGANFFAFAPGKIMGYGRNLHTIEALSNAGFEVVKAWDVVDGKRKVEVENEAKPIVYTIDSAELVRGGGGCRCMTMPVSRDDIW